MPKWEWENIWRKNAIPSIPIRIWTWKQWDRSTFWYTDAFSFYKHPRNAAPKKTGLPFPAASLGFSAFPLGSLLCDQHKLWTLPLLTTLPGHLFSPVLGGNSRSWLLPSGADTLWPIVCGATLLSRRCPSRTPISRSEWLSILAHIKGEPGIFLRASVQRSHNQPNNTRLFNVSNSSSSAPPPPLPLREN